MKNSLVRLTLAAFVASTALATAQHAVPRDGGGGGSSSGGAGSSGTSSSSGGSGSSGGSTFSSPSDGGGSRAVPRHPTTTSSGGGGGGRAGAARGGGESVGSGRSRGGGGSGYVNRSPDGAPVTSRRQGDRPTVGYAVPRGTVVVPPGRPGGDYYYYPRGWNWYHNPWGYGGWGLGGWGLGYIWDPFWYPPIGWGPGYGNGFYGPGYGAGYSDSDPSSGYAGDYRRDDEGEGALRIKVKPREARVLVDGLLAGTVDDFDGKFQKLALGAGAHKVKLEAEGYEPLTFDVMIVDGQTVNYKGQMRKQ